MIGDKSWWLDYLRRNPNFIIHEDRAEYNEYIEVTNRKLQPLGGGLFHGPEKILRDTLVQINLFPKHYFEERVKLGKDTKQIDVLGQAHDSDWVIECKVEQSDTAALDIRAIGQAIGQVIILYYLYKVKYKQLLSRPVMPTIACWLLGSGSSVIKDICKIFGITLIELLPSTPPYLEESIIGPTARIYFLNEKSPILFSEDWSGR